MGDDCLSVVVVVTALFTVATGADSLLLAAEASPQCNSRDFS